MTGKLIEKETAATRTMPTAAIAPNGQLKTWLRRAGLAALGTAGTLALAIGAASYPLSGLLIRPRLKRLTQLKSPRLKEFMGRVGVEFEEVSIASFDGTKLYGWWLQAAADAPTVVVLHGVKKNRTAVLRAALTLRRAGFNALVFDGRAHGSSEGRYVTYGFYERRDVESALEWLVNEKKVKKECIGLAGESMGAAIALQVAAHVPWVRAVWADSPFASLRRVVGEFVSRMTRMPEVVVQPVLWPAIRVAGYRGKFDVEMVNPLALAAQIKCSVYLVHGTADELIPHAHSQNIHDALPGGKELWIIEGGRHARSARHQKREYSRRLTEFFTANLGPRS